MEFANESDGYERRSEHEKIWRLNVQGVILELTAPTIVVRQALLDAGFDPDQGWQIFLKVHGQPKREVSLADTIDLCTPGVEKLRLVPKHVINGDREGPPQRTFPSADEGRTSLNLGLRDGRR